MNLFFNALNENLDQVRPNHALVPSSTQAVQGPSLMSLANVHEVNESMRSLATYTNYFEEILDDIRPHNENVGIYDFLSARANNPDVPSEVEMQEIIERIDYLYNIFSKLPQSFQSNYLQTILDCYGLKSELFEKGTSSSSSTLRNVEEIDEGGVVEMDEGTNERIGRGGGDTYFSVPSPSQIRIFTSARFGIVATLYVKLHVQNVWSIYEEAERLQQQMIFIMEKMRIHRTILFHITGDLAITSRIIDIPSEVSSAHFMDIEDRKDTPFHTFYLYVCDQLKIHNFRRNGSDCFAQKYVQSDSNIPIPTHAWERECSISQFITEVCRKEICYQIWQIMVIGNNLKKCAEMLEMTDEIEFPELKIDRHKFSFNNGIYDCKMNTFVEYGSDMLTSDVVSAKFFNEEFHAEMMDEQTDWYHIKTPEVDKILLFQDISEDVARVFYGMVGRLFYEVGELDDFQVILFIKGLANTGKSSIQKLVENFYQKEHVGVLSSNIEVQFGLSALVDKLIFLCFEVKSRFALPLAEFQSMVSGESLSVAVKQKTAIMKKWTAPGMLAGNDIANMADSGGSVVRRVPMIEFHKAIPPHKRDGKLGEKLLKNMAATILKCNLAYHDLIRKADGRDFWYYCEKYCPYFLETRNRMRQHTSVLVEFLDQSEDFMIHPKLFVLEKHFRIKFLEYCREVGVRQPKWSVEQYIGIFSEKRIEKVKDTRVYQNETRYGEYLVGIGYRSDYKQLQMDENQENASIPI